MSSNTGWIDFKALRERLDFLKVMEHYNVKLKVKGRQATGFCPLPKHQGKKNSPSFSVNLEKNIFQCFGCQAKGNVIDFACLMGGRDPKKGADVHDVALELEHRFLGNSTKQDMKGNTPSHPSGKSQQRSPDRENISTIVNAPLDFELKNLDPEHPYLKGRGFTAETIRHFGLGFCKRGMLRDRIAVPLHDNYGRLVGYAGRVIDDNTISAENPKYLFPTDRKRAATLFEFKKSHLLYNAHNIVKAVDALVVVEGFPAAWWLWQHGYWHMTAVMGSSCSKEQGRLIIELVQPSGIVLAFTDGNDAGRKCAASLFQEVGPHRLMRYLKLCEDEQPTDCTGDELAALLEGAGQVRTK